MARLGTKERPIIVRVRTDEMAYYVAQTCGRNGWEYIIGLEPDRPEDISDLERMLKPAVPATSTKVERNGPCPCGSRRKYKKCCGTVTSAVP